jgi:translation initiation factor SUI1
MSADLDIGEFFDRARAVFSAAPLPRREWVHQQRRVGFCWVHTIDFSVNSSRTFAGIAGAGPTDPFASGGRGGGKIHIRVQQRNGRKCITTIQGLDDDLDLKRMCKAMKRTFNCNGSIEADKEMGEVIQLQVSAHSSA